MLLFSDKVALHVTRGIRWDSDHVVCYTDELKEIAKENRVPVVENKPLARMLYHNVDIGTEIPPELYQAVAEVLAMIYQS